MSTNNRWYGVATALGVVVLVLLLVGGHALAKKPVKPPPVPDTPSYVLVDCGVGGYYYAMNENGDLAGETERPVDPTAPWDWKATLILPEDTDDDGYPDAWFRDGGGGVNDLRITLGNLGVVGPNEPSSTFDVNNYGEAVGISGFDNQIRNHGFVWDGVAMHDLGAIFYETFTTHADAINDDGVVLGLGGGYATEPPEEFADLGQQHFIVVPVNVDGVRTWYVDADGDDLNDLMQPLGSEFSRASCLDEAGRVPGVDSRGPVLLTPLDSDEDGYPDTWFRDENTDDLNDLAAVLPAPTGYTWVEFHAMNENGWIVGSWDNSRGVRYAALWRPQASGAYEFVDLGEVSRCVETVAWDVNDDNVILGSGRTRKGAFESVLWVDGVQESLNDQVDAAGRTLSYPIGINNRGEIAMSTDDGPVVLVPVP